MTTILEKYPPGTTCKYQPKPASLEAAWLGDWLKQNVLLTKAMLEGYRRGDRFITPASLLGVGGARNVQQVEKAAVSAGLTLVYAARPTLWGKKKVTLSVRTIALEEEPLIRYLRGAKSIIQQKGLHPAPAELRP